MDDASALGRASQPLGGPDLQAFSPKQEKALDKITGAQENRVAIWQQIDKAVGGPLLPDQVEAVLHQHPEWRADLADADKRYNAAMRAGVRAGLDTYPYTLVKCEQPRPHEASGCATCTRKTAIRTLARSGLVGYPGELREWIVMCQVFGERNKLHALWDVRPDLEEGVQAPMSVKDVALAEVWCDQKRAHKSDGQVFQLVTAKRRRGEVEDRKQNTKESLRIWAKRHHLDALLAMEPELIERQPVIEQLVAKNASLQEVIEQLTPRFRASS